MAVIKGTETEEELDALEKRGFSLVKVIQLAEDGNQTRGEEGSQGQ